MKLDQTDEGYVEQRFDEPHFMKDWTDDQKAEFAYQLLLCIPVSKTVTVVDRLSPLLHRDYISFLPYEIAVQILYYVDIHTITCIARVSKHWKRLTDDQTLWKSFFFASGWKVNQPQIEKFLASSSDLIYAPHKTVSATHLSNNNKNIFSIPLARTNATLYDPTSLPTMPGAPTTRLKPFKRSTDFFIDKLLRTNNISSSSSSSSSSSNSSISSSSNTKDANHTMYDDHHYYNNSSLVAALRPTQVYPSRSQPLSPSKHREVLSHMIIERPFLNRPAPRRHVKYDEAAIFHYREYGDTRFINWKRLYRNRNLIDRRWQEGKCKMRPFPPNNAHDIILTEDAQHNSGIYCLQFDSNILLTGSRDQNLKMWDIKTGRLLHKLEGHTGSVLCLQFDQRFLISGSSDGSLIVWDIHTGKKIKTLLGHGESVLNVKFIDNTVVSCSKDRTVRTWDLEKGAPLLTFRGHRAAVNAVQFKGDRIVSASGDRTIKIWDMNTGECLKTLDSHSRGIACVEYDGQYIVSGSSDQSIKVWDALTGECLHTLVGHTDLVRTLQLDSKSKTIVSGSYDGSLKIWRLEDGKLLRTLNQSLHGRILNLQFDFSKILCSSNLGKIVMYDFAHGMDTHFLI